MDSDRHVWLSVLACVWTQRRFAKGVLSQWKLPYVWPFRRENLELWLTEVPLSQKKLPHLVYSQVELAQKAISVTTPAHMMLGRSVY